MKKSALCFTVFILILFNTTGCVKKALPPEKVDTFQQMVNIISENKEYNFKAIVKITDHYMNTYLYADMHPGTINIQLLNNQFDIQKKNVPFSDMILSMISKDLYVTYFGGNTPYQSDQKYGYTYELSDTVKGVFNKSGETLYQITYEGKLITIYNVKHHYSLKVLNNRPISINLLSNKNK